MDLLRRIFDITEDTHPEILDEMMSENRRQGNIYAAKVLLLMSAGLLVALILNELELFEAKNPDKSLVYIIAIAVLTATAVICYMRDGGNSSFKFTMLAELILCSSAVTVVNVYGYWACYIVAIATSCRYYDRVFTVVISFISILTGVASTFLGVQYGIKIGSVDVTAFDIPDGADVTISGTLGSTLVEDGYITREMIYDYSWGQCLNLILVLAGAAYMAYKITKHGKMAVIAAAELTAEKQESALRAEEMRTKMLISQIQPHFLYNSLTAIMAIDDNPDETVEAIADFSMYLRENLNVLTTIGNIPFTQEMEHVERYMTLEKLRFGETLDVEYDIQDTDFEIPPLTVQMIAENSVKHGVTAKRGGGTVWISSSLEDVYHVIRIRDNGKGFNVELVGKDEHVGLGSVKKRITELGGKVNISSEIGEGTEVEVYIPV